jgi:hypothetical protein
LDRSWESLIAEVTKSFVAGVQEVGLPDKGNHKEENCMFWRGKIAEGSELSNWLSNEDVSVISS